MTTAIERERPALAFIPNPNSPTGNSFNLDALQRLARKMDGLFVVDEAYADFAEQSIIPRIQATPGLFVMRSLSKIGFAALRVGALIGERAAIAELGKVRLPYNVNAVSLAFASCVLADPERLKARIAAIVKLRCELETALRNLDGVEVWPSRANFVLLRTAFPAEVIFHRMLARGIVLRVFTRTPSLARCVRITCGTHAQNARCLNALSDVLAELGREQRRPTGYQSRL